MNVQEYMVELGQNARTAAKIMATATTQMKNNALLAVASALDSQREIVISANQADMAAGP